MTKILILIGDAVEALEVFYPLQRLLEEGWQVTLAAPQERVYQTVVHDFEPGFDTYTEKKGYRIKADVALLDTRPSEFDGLVLPGGRAPEYLRNQPGVIGWVSEFFQSGKPVAAICHAGLILTKAHLLQGRRCTAYPQLACDMEAAGATFLDQDVVVDGNLVTSRAWPDNPVWMKAFIELVQAAGFVYL
jgi:protease I